MGVDGHHHQRVDTIETAEVDAVAYHQGSASVRLVSENDAVPLQWQVVLTENAVVVGATVALKVEGAQRVAAEEGLQQVGVDAGGVVDGAFEAIMVSVVDGIVEVEVVGGVDFQVEGLETVACMVTEEEVGIVARLSVGRIDKETRGVVTDGVVGMIVIGRPHLEVKRGKRVAVVD